MKGCLSIVVSQSTYGSLSDDALMVIISLNVLWEATFHFGVSVRRGMILCYSTPVAGFIFMGDIK